MVERTTTSRPARCKSREAGGVDVGVLLLGLADQVAGGLQLAGFARRRRSWDWRRAAPGTGRPASLSSTFSMPRACIDFGGRLRRWRPSRRSTSRPRLVSSSPAFTGLISSASAGGRTGNCSIVEVLLVERRAARLAASSCWPPCRRRQRRPARRSSRRAAGPGSRARRCRRA